MTTIKLNNYYPHLTECITLEVSEEIAVTLSIGGRQCDSYKRRNPCDERRKARRQDSPLEEVTKAGRAINASL